MLQVDIMTNSLYIVKHFIQKILIYTLCQLISVLDFRNK